MTKIDVVLGKLPANGPVTCGSLLRRTVYSSALGSSNLFYCFSLAVHILKMLCTFFGHANANMAGQHLGANALSLDEISSVV